MASGGIIPPQGRPPSAPGIGRDAKRHDLERPKTPGLSNSSLQYGDVQKLEQGQRVAPPLKQRNPSGAGGSVPPQGGGTGSPASGSGGFSVPNPVDFAKRRLGGTLDGPPSGPVSTANPAQWIPIFRRLANAPNSSGILRNALVAQLGTLINNPQTASSSVLDLDQMDADLEYFSNAL